MKLRAASLPRPFSRTAGLAVFLPVVLAAVLAMGSGCGSDPPPPEEDDEPTCPQELDPTITLSSGYTEGTTAEASDDFTPECALSNAPDITHRLVVPGVLLSLVADTTGSQFDTVMTIESPICSAPELECDDDGGSDTQSRVQLEYLEPGEYSIIIDGFDEHAGTYALNVHGVIAGGEPCDPELIASGLFSCEVSYACADNECAPAACNNGRDDDGDGRIDVLEDPGCLGIGDADESDDCPAGPLCPVCSNERDDDEDGLVDFPEDMGCSTPRDTNELECDESYGIVTLKDPQTIGNTVGTVHDYTPGCSPGSTAAEVVHQLDLPGRLNFLFLDTFGSTFDTMLYARPGSCDAPDLACDDDDLGTVQSAIELGAVEPGTLYIMVDGFSTNEGPYVLNAFGEIAVGEPCDITHVTTGLLVCANGTACVDQGAGLRCQ